MTVSELKTRMTASEMIDWEVLEDVDPWGQRREDYRTAMLCAVIMNAGGWRKTGSSKPFTEDDFMLDFLPRSIAVVNQNAQVIEAELKAWIKSSNAAFKEASRT